MLKFAKTALFIAVLASSVAAQAAQEKTSTIPETSIDSDSLELLAGEDVNSFHFAGNVRADSQGMFMTCDKLDVVVRRMGKSKATIGRMNSVKSIVAQGHVRMEQTGRVAVAGRAEVLPDEGLVVLSDNPKIIDSKATVEGWKIIYNSRDRTAQVLPTPDDQLLPGQKKTRSHVIISEQAVPKLDYQQVMGADKPEEKSADKAPEAKTAPKPAPAAK
jgi:lipopolysaccharide export system protein LptA